MEQSDRFSGVSPLRRNSSFRRLIKAWASGKLSRGSRAPTTKYGP